MIPISIQKLMPEISLGLGALCWVIYLTWAIRRGGLKQRPLLLSLSILGALPALYVGVTWVGWLPERYLRVERPVLAIPAAIAITFVAARLLRLSPRQGIWRRRLTELLTGLAALAAAASAMGLELGRPLDRLAIIVAVDRSRSIDLVPEADARIRSELQVAEVGMRDDDRIGTVVFAAGAAVEDPLRPKTRLPAPQKVELGRDGTDLGEAIRRALAEVPSDAAARIVILSDGVSTRGDPLEAAAAAVAAGVPVDVVPLDQAKVPDVRVVAVRMPPRASEGETMELRIVTSASEASEIEVRLLKNGELVKKGNTKVAKGEDVLRLLEQAPGPGLHRYDVEITAKKPEQDQAPEDNSGSAFVRVRGQAAALVMESDPRLSQSLVNALSSAAFRVDSVGPGGIPADIAGFAAYDVVALSDIPASALSPTQIAALASYVRDLGGGLLLLGGDQSMGPGGYGKTPIEEVSPVSFDLKQERRRASLAEVIVIDYSGSMAMRVGGKTKLELANEASARSAELLSPSDRLGVMHVDTAVSWTVPLGPVTDKKKIANDIRAVGPGGGGIYVDLSLRAGYEALAREKVNLKHLLLFSDGSDAEERSNAFALVSGARARGITTSVVALGRGGDVIDLEKMSKLGDGRFYLIEDASRLPAVFAQETILAARSSINETVFRPSPATPGAATRGVDFRDAPALSGYVVTIPKGRAQIHLKGPEGDPILGTWSIGIGRSAAFTSDYKDRWGQAWTSWGGAARMFGQLARDIARRADDPRVRLEADATGGELHVRATVVDDDGRTESFRRLKVRIGGPDGFGQELPLEAVGAGAYAASIPLSRPGAYIATAIDEVKNEPVGTTGSVLTAGEELRPTGSDRALLARIASLTGGKQRDTMAGIFHDRDARRFAYRSLTPWLLLGSGFLLLFAVGARRLAWPEFKFFARWRERAKRRGERAAEPAAADASDTTSALLSARARHAEQRGPVVVDDRPPPSVPRFSQAVPARPAPAPAGQRPPPVAPQARPPAAGPPASQRQLSAAEILLARRRGKQ